MSCIINDILEKQLDELNREEEEMLVSRLIKRMEIEFSKQDKSGIYGLTQYQMTYNSNKIEGSKLTENQTISLFETGTIFASSESFRAKDIEEATGHFMMFNEMLNTYTEPLTEQLIKRYHYKLKSGVFEDQANGYPVGEYKNRVNRVSNLVTASPDEVSERIKELLDNYNSIANITLKDLAEFHIQYERIHPFQDGNGRTGRIILYKECLRNSLLPFIIRDNQKAEYYHALQDNCPDELKTFFEKEQGNYFEQLKEFLYVYEKNLVTDRR